MRVDSVYAFAIYRRGRLGIARFRDLPDAIVKQRELQIVHYAFDACVLNDRILFSFFFSVCSG